MGRLFGNIVTGIFGNIFTNVQPAVYAIIASAAFTASVTRCLSVAIIIFELSSSVTLIVPVMLGVLVSYAVSNSLSIGVFDVILEMKGLPYLPTLKSVDSYNMEARHIMA
jgi:H+/Cl- antiporter ClcA